MRQFIQFFAILPAIFIAQFLHAQVSVGVKTGLHLGDARVEGVSDQYLPDPTMYEGAIFGAIVQIPMQNGFSFQPEINFVQKGFRVMSEYGLSDADIPVGVGMKTRLNYLEVPLFIKYSHGNDLAKWYVMAGPNVSYAMDGWVRPVVRAVIDFTLPRQDLNLSNDLYRRWEISATGAVGGEIKAGSGKLFADIRYTHGFSNLFDNPIIDVRLKNQGFGLSAGYAYTF